MSKSIKTLTSKANAIANGNYLEEINPQTYKFGMSGLSAAIESMQTQLLSHVFEMQVVASQIDSSTSAIGSVLDNQKKISDEIFKNSENLAIANHLNFDKVSESVDVAKSMVENTQVLQASAARLQESSASSKAIIASQLDSIAQVIALIDNISATSKASVAYINKLNFSTQKIAEILTTVQTFYKQTQLLSLNASIESARAGEAGAGFSVVANQIRVLAQSSSHSVDEISSIIKEVDFDIHNVIEQSKLTQESVFTAVENTQVIKKGLQKIEDSYLEVDQSVHGMKNKLDENLDLFDQLNSTITQSSSASEQVAQEIIKMNDHIETLYKKNNDITKLETNLKDTSSSLHALTNKMDVNLLAATKGHINQQTQDLIEHLTVISEKNAGLKQNNIPAHKKILDIVLECSKQIEAIWTNDAGGNFIYSNPPAGIPNALIRDWYTESIKGEIFVSDVYISAISKNPCITISLPLYNDFEDIVGVIGADIGVSYKS